MKESKIEWCNSTWNPISGCLKGCEFCYAARTANRFKGCEESPDGYTEKGIVYLKERLHCIDSKGNRRPAAYPYGFTPTFHEYRLKDLVTTGLGETIFICSMADMFGPWVPDEWIEKIFAACENAPGHRYLFLTKYPDRYLQLAKNGILRENDSFWYGSTVTDPYKDAFYSDKHHTFISVEPILEPFTKVESQLAENIDWMILGAETGNRKDKVVPERAWIEEIVEQFQSRGKPVFMKDSMIPVWGKDILTELPWGK